MNERAASWPTTRGRIVSAYVERTETADEGAASAAVPGLLRRLSDEAEYKPVREYVAEALRAIDPEAAKEAGVP
jgi:HEAT repeat protein